MATCYSYIDARPFEVQGGHIGVREEDSRRLVAAGRGAGRLVVRQQAPQRSFADAELRMFTETQLRASGSAHEGSRVAHWKRNARVCP